MPTQSNVKNNLAVPGDGLDGVTDSDGNILPEAQIVGKATRTVQDIFDELTIVGQVGNTSTIPYLMRLLNDGIHDMSINVQKRTAQSLIDLKKEKRLYSFNDVSDSVVAIDIVKIEIKDDEGRYIPIPKLNNSYLLKGHEEKTSFDTPTATKGISSNPNSEFAWYTDENNFYIVYNRASDEDTTVESGEYDTYNGDGCLNGIRIEYHLAYIAAQSAIQDLQKHLGIPVALHSCLVDYMKSRLHEDMKSYETASYHYKKYKNQMKKYPARLSGIRVLSVPRM